MLIADELQKLFPELFRDESTQITFDVSDVSVRIFGRQKNVSLSTPVYFGGNYIPQSVRLSLNQSLPLQNMTLKTFFSIDEENFRIYLHHNNVLESMNDASFRDLLDDFIWIAEEWRLFLDENDRNDLVYVSKPL